MKRNSQYFCETRKVFHPDSYFSTISRIQRRVEEWAGYSRVKSLLNINDIKDGIDAFYRDIDACFDKFHVRLLLFCPKMLSLSQPYIRSRSVWSSAKANGILPPYKKVTGRR